MEKLAEARRRSGAGGRGGNGSTLSRTLGMLHPKVRALVESRGWSSLTDVQEKAIPVILSGANTLVMAPTGEGKTEAAMLPILSQIVSSDAQEPVTVLYITPMKALINDLYRRISELAKPLGLRVARKHGDTPASERNRRHRSVPHILITTPESLEIDLDWAPKFRRYYRNLRFVVVDEVHELLSGKRGAQLVLQLERLRRLSGRDFQVVALSATVGDPERVLDLLSGSSRRPRSIVESGSRKNIVLEVGITPGDGDPWRELARLISRVARENKPILVFVNSRFAAEQLKTALEELGVDDVFVHHSSVSAELREEAEEKLRRGELSAVVCTKTLEVGIDVGKVRVVVQVKSPGRVASLLQRVGRSGHVVGGTPRGIILATDEFDFMESLAIARLALQGRVENIALRRIPLDVVARQLLGILLAQKEAGLAEILNLLEPIAEKIGVTEDDIHRLVEYMASTRVIKVEGEGREARLRIGPTFYKIWKFRGDPSQRAWWSRSFSEFFSMITERDSFTVKHGDKTIGSIDSVFVYRHLRVGDTIRLAGRSWRVKRIDENLARVDVEPSSSQAEVPLWRGEGPRRHRIVADSLASILLGLNSTGVRLGEREKRIVGEWVRVYQSLLEGRDPRSVLIYERYLDEHVFTAMLGSGANEALALAVVHVASKKVGMNVRYRASYAGFSVYTGDVNPLAILKTLDPGELEKIVESALDKSPYLYQVAREIQLSFGRIGSPDPSEDEFLFEEAKRQVIDEYLDLVTARDFLRRLQAGEVEVVFPMISGLSPIAREIVKSPSIRPWLPDLAMRIARFLEGAPMTVIDIADALELAEKTVESKLKDMRKPEYGDLRVVPFYDVDTGEVRWALLRELEEIAEMEEYRDSFTPRRVHEPLRVYVRLAPGQRPREIILKPADLLANGEKIIERFPREVYSVKIMSAYDEDGRDELSVTHYHVPSRALRLLLLNAARYLENKYYEEFF